MYNKQIMDIFLNSEFRGDLKGSDVSTQLKDGKTGEIIKLYFTINKFSVVEDVKFKAFGGVMVVYAAHMISQLSKGKTLFELNVLTANKFMSIANELSDDHYYLAELAVNAVLENNKKYAKKNDIDLTNKATISNKLENIVLKIKK